MHSRVHLPSFRRRSPAGADRGLVRRLVAEMAHTPSELIVLAGTWLTFAPLVLDHGTADISFIGWNDVIVGSALVALAFLRVVLPDDTGPLGLINLGLGAWLIAAPFVRGYYTAPLATLNDVIVGGAVVVLATASWKAERSVRQRTSTLR